MVPPRSPGGDLQNGPSRGVLVCRQRAIGWHERVRRRRLGAAPDAKQLFPLHDEVDDADDESGQRQRQAVEPVAWSATCAHEKTRHAGRHFIEHERPRHFWRAVRRQPAKRQHPLVFDRQQGESLRHAGQRREDRADGRMLQFRHDARGARLPAVVEPVVAVPAAAAARSHLHQPRPHVTRRRVESSRRASACRWPVESARLRAARVRVRLWWRGPTARAAGSRAGRPQRVRRAGEPPATAAR